MFTLETRFNICQLLLDEHHLNDLKCILNGSKKTKTPAIFIKKTKITTQPDCMESHSRTFLAGIQPLWPQWMPDRTIRA
jgi:hypothetical protein